MKKRAGGANQRLAMLLGWRTRNNEKPVEANIPSKDRSNFSQQRYQFFLKAPFEISHKCCDEMKKKPLHAYTKETGRFPITAQMADESRLRLQKWLQHGCNAFDAKTPISNPMSFWLENDILEYIKLYIERPLKEAWGTIYNTNRKKRKAARKYLRKINYRKTAICPVYGDIVEDFGDQLDGQMDLSDYGLAEPEKKYKTTGCKRTGCCLCAFGAHLDKQGEERFLMLKDTHPKMYRMLDLVTNNGVTFREAIEWTNEHGNLNIPL